MVNGNKYIKNQTAICKELTFCIEPLKFIHFCQGHIGDNFSKVCGKAEKKGRKHLDSLMVPANDHKKDTTAL